MLSPETYFANGIAAFNAGDYFDAHEQWEDMWSLYQLPDRLFIQGLIQMAVGCFHLTQDNLNGARGLFTKCILKLETAPDHSRGLDVPAILTFARQAREQVHAINSCGDFDWSGVPTLNSTEVHAPGE